MASKRSFPAALSVVMIVIVLAAIATWLIPAGSYKRLSFEDGHFIVSGTSGSAQLAGTQKTLDTLGINIKLEKFQQGDIRKPVAIPNTYKPEEKNPQNLVNILEAPLKGIYDTIDIILFILIIGGFIAIFYESGALDKGIRYLALKMKGKESTLIILFTFLFALGGSGFGMAEETMAFYPLLVPVFLAAGYDLLMPVGVIFLGSNIGTMAAVTCPFSVIIASDAAGINWTAGTTGRILMFFICTGITIFYLLRYGKKVRKDPSQSLVLKYDGPIASLFPSVEAEPPQRMTQKDKLVLLLFAATFFMLVYGVVALDWWLLEMTALFFTSALLLAVILRMNEKVFIEKFIKGAQSLLAVAFIVGLARGVTIILNDGRISDSILFYSSHVVDGMSSGLFIVSLLVLFLLLTIFISSSSGMAVLTMPIIAPLGIVAGVGTEHIVDAYLFGMGIMNIITPTGLALPALTMVNVSYKTWIKFMTPLMIMLTVVSIIYLVVTVML